MGESVMIFTVFCDQRKRRYRAFSNK